MTQFRIPKLDDDGKIPADLLPETGITNPLPNATPLLGTTPEGGSVALIQQSQWGLVDIGSVATNTNITSKERPTIQLEGQAGETAEHAAFLSDIPTAPGQVGAATSAQGLLADTAVQPEDLTPYVTQETFDADLQLYVPVSRTVAGKDLAEDVTLEKSDVGLENVDNTTDANKPVSTATWEALGGKLDTSAVAGLDTVGWGRVVYIPNGGTVPEGTPAYTQVIEMGA